MILRPAKPPSSCWRFLRNNNGDNKIAFTILLGPILWGNTYRNNNQYNKSAFTIFLGPILWRNTYQNNNQDNKSAFTISAQ